MRKTIKPAQRGDFDLVDLHKSGGTPYRIACRQRRQNHEDLRKAGLPPAFSRYSAGPAPTRHSVFRRPSGIVKQDRHRFWPPHDDGRETGQWTFSTRSTLMFDGRRSFRPSMSFLGGRALPVSRWATWARACTPASVRPAP